MLSCLFHEMKFLTLLPYQGQEGYSLDLGFERNTARDSGNAKFLEEIRDLSVTREAGFAKTLVWNAVFGKKTLFGMEMTEVRDQA